MARTPMQGLEYFPLLTNLDDKFKMIEALHGIAGFGVAIKLFQKIYANNYHILADERFIIVFSNDINVDINSINVIINDSVKWGLFDKGIFDEFNVLTSRGIQKQYFSITHRRKTVEVIEDLLLISTPKDKNIRTVDNIYKINADINSINDDRSTQREREREIKGKEKKKNKEIYKEKFDLFWKAYPGRNGRKVGKQNSKKNFFLIPESELDNVIKAAKICCDETDFPKDPERFLKDNYWKDYLEPKTTQSKNNNTDESMFERLQKKHSNKENDIETTYEVMQ